MTIAGRSKPISRPDSYDPARRVLINSWQLDLRSRNLSPKTIEVYVTAADRFDSWLLTTEGGEHKGGWETVRKALIQAYIAHLADSRSPGYASNQYRALQQLWKWLDGEGEVQDNPFLRMRGPMVPEKPIPVVESDGLTKLLATCSGRDFVSRRDSALFALYIDTGARLSEIANLSIKDVDMELREITVLGKGRRIRRLRIGRKASAALDRYLRMRSTVVAAQTTEALWLGKRGPLTANGIAQMIERRGNEAGIPNLHPHQLRHSYAHSWLKAGGSESDLMVNAGWRSRQMIMRYGASLAGDRARSAAERNSPLDRL